MTAYRLIRIIVGMDASNMPDKAPEKVPQVSSNKSKSKLVRSGERSTGRPLWMYRVLLGAAAAVWGLGFTIGKSAIATVGATWFTAFRFLGATLVLTILLFPHIRRHLNARLVRAGCIMGLFSFLGFWTQFLGLGWTTPSKNAFLSACYCLTVPFIWWIISRKRPENRTLIAAVICVIGIGLVSLDEGFSIGLGDAMSILSAVLYGVEIVVISLTMKDNDVLTVTVVQQLMAGILALAVAMLTQPWPTMVQLTQPDFIGAMLYVILGSAAFGAIAQNAAQKHISPSEAGLLCSLESVFCALFGAVFFGEVMTAKMIAGFVLIFAAIVVVQVHPSSGESPESPELIGHSEH